MPWSPASAPIAAIASSASPDAWPCVPARTPNADLTSTRASAEEIDEVAEVSFQRSHYRLDGDGLLVDLRVDLPAGLQWSPEISKDTARYLGRIPMPDVRINQALKPALATATYDIGRVNLSEETNPLIFSANSLVWEIPQGSFQLLGNLQAFWILGFVATQFPVGWALDTIGPRRTVALQMLAAQRRWMPQA